jgi:membrane dipeptidase
MTTTARFAERAARLIRDTIVWDNHACMPLRPGDTRFLDQLAQHRASGATAVTLNVSMDMIPWPETFKVIATMRRWIKAHPDEYILGESVAAIEGAKASGRLAVLFDIEGAGAVDDLPDLVEAYYTLGVRWMLIAYNRQNRLGAGCQVENDAGLTDYGRRVIDAMHEVGMILCCSHTGKRTAAEAIAYARQPVIFSHSNAEAVHPHRRNISDDLIRACAATGGVIGLVGYGDFVGPEGQVTVDKLTDHAGYIAGLVGASHLGLGLDYVFDPDEGVELIENYPGWFPGMTAGIDMSPMIGPREIPAIAEALLRRNWSEDDVAGVLGGNLMRVARQVWKD